MMLGKFRIKRFSPSFSPSKSALSCVLGVKHSYEVLDTVHEYFQLQTKVRARQFRTNLRSVQLEGKSMREYLTQIKVISDVLTGVGCPVKHEDYVDVLLVNIP